MILTSASLVTKIAALVQAALLIVQVVLPLFLCSIPHPTPVLILVKVASF